MVAKDVFLVLLAVGSVLKNGRLLHHFEKSAKEISKAKKHISSGHLIFGVEKGESMKTTFRNVIALATALTLSALLAVGCSGGAEERAVFARNLTDPDGEPVASTSGPENETLVIHLLRATPADAEILIHEKRLPLLRHKGFTRVEVRGSEGKILWERHLN